MLDLRKRRLGKQGRLRLPEGVYDSVVVEVKWADGYDFEEAYQITYEITGSDGKTYRHSEIFMTNSRNLRTAEFEDYLADHGIENLADFKGKRERLTFEYKEAYTGKTYFNITNREFQDD